MDYHIALLHYCRWKCQNSAGNDLH